MTKKITVLLTALVLAVAGLGVMPTQALAGHWVYCSYPTNAYPYNHIAHSPKVCYAPGFWIWVSWG